MEPKEKIKKIGQAEDYFENKILTVDSNYHNQDTLKKCLKEKLDAYIPDLRFRTRDVRFSTRPRSKPKKSKKYVLEDFRYNEVKDQYICPNGKILKLNSKDSIRYRIIYRRYLADEKDCKQCSLKSRCFYRKNTKRCSLDVPIGADEDNYSKAMAEKVDSDKGRQDISATYGHCGTCICQYPNSEAYGSFYLQRKN